MIQKDVAGVRARPVAAQMWQRRCGEARAAAHAFFGEAVLMSSVQSVLERNRGKLHLPTSGAGCSTKTPSVQIWIRKGRIWRKRRGSTWTQLAELFGFRHAHHIPLPIKLVGASLPYRYCVPGNEARSDHDSAAVLQLQSGRTCPESVGTPCDADG